MEFIFQQLQLENLAEKGLDPIKVAHRMLKDFTRSLFIDTRLQNGGAVDDDHNPGHYLEATKR